MLRQNHAAFPCAVIQIEASAVTLANNQGTLPGRTAAYSIHCEAGKLDTCDNQYHAVKLLH